MGNRRIDPDDLAMLVRVKQVRVSYDEATVDLKRLKAILEVEEYPVAWVMSIGRQGSATPTRHRPRQFESSPS